MRVKHKFRLKSQYSIPINRTHVDEIKFHLSKINVMQKDSYIAWLQYSCTKISQQIVFDDEKIIEHYLLLYKTK